MSSSADLRSWRIQRCRLDADSAPLDLLLIQTLFESAKKIPSLTTLNSTFFPDSLVLKNIKICRQGGGRRIFGHCDKLLGCQVLCLVGSCEEPEGFANFNFGSAFAACRGGFPVIPDRILRFCTAMARCPSPDEAREILRAARSGNLDTFTRLLADYNVNFQAPAISGGHEAPTVEKYADDHHILQAWRKHIIENALPAFHQGRTSLHMAASNGQLQIVRYICRNQHPQRDINIRDKFGYTALHLAAHSFHAKRDEIIEEMLKCPDIDPNVVATNMGDGRLLSTQDTKSWSDTPFHSAAHSFDANSDEIITEMRPNIDPNVVATNVGDGRLPSTQDTESWNDTPLHLATFLGFTKTVEQLLEWRSTTGNIIDVTARNRWGFTPLHQAVNNTEMLCAVPITRALLKFMDERKIPDVVNAPANKKLTPLHIAVMRGSYKLVDLLLRAHSIDADLKDKRGFTPFDIAVRDDDYKLVLMLQSHFERTGLYGDDKAYASAASAILVGASLLASVTFAAWLHPPSSYFQTVPDSYNEMEHQPPKQEPAIVWDIQMFWVFDSLSFYLAVATFFAAAGVAIPSKGIRLAHNRSAVHLATFFVVLSISFGMGAFAMAGLVLLPHPDAYRWSIIRTTALGGTICLLPLLLFLRRLLRAICPYYFYLDFKITGWFMNNVKDPLKNCILKLKGVKRFVESYNSIVNPDIMRPDLPYGDQRARERASRRAHEYINKQ
jgi:ankyrin repeat protein